MIRFALWMVRRRRAARDARAAMPVDDEELR
jgi:hypothetical protein